jgi:DNA-directed RNA polymerase I, II, and III subunit RPABC4
MQPYPGAQAGAAGGLGPLPQDVATAYICGNCGEEVKLKPSEPIVCRSCGFRILSKKRTNRVVQFEAR